MKKLFYLFVPLLALFLALVPQFARAEVGNIDDYLIQPFTIEFGPVSNKGYLRIYTNDTYNSTIVTIDLEYRMATDDGDFGAWTRLATKGTTTSTELYNAAQTAFTLSSGHTYKIQLRGKNPEGFCKNSTDNYQILPQCYGAVSKVKMYGNIMSLIKGFDTDNLSDAQEVLREADEIPKDYCFYKLFYAQQLQNGSPATYYAPILDASNLIFPATKLRNSCYMNLFGEFYDKGTYGRSTINTGIFAGPTFLATAFVDIDGKPVTSAFQSMFLNCSALTSVKINLQYSPAANDANLLYWMKGTYAAYGYNNSNKVIFAPSIFFTSSILSNSEYISQPSTTSQRQWEQMVFSYPYSSPTLSPASADANETLTANTKKILYPLTPTTINGITYTPVDMGDGIAWADRNVGAATTDAVGDYFMWGRPDAKTSSGVGTGSAYTIYTGGVMNSGDILPVSADIATMNIGSNWRMPTQADLVNLYESTTQAGRTFTNKADNSKSITIPASGYMNSGTSKQSTSAGQFWSSELDLYYGENSYWNSKAKGLSISNGNVDYTQTLIYCGMPVRAVYDPSVLDPTFKTHTLRIITGDYHIDFICQHGQTVTITAVPDYENCKAFRYWDDNHSNTTAERTFTVNDDATYTAVFWSDPNAVPYTATFYAADGETILDQDDYCEGQYIVYDGTTPVIAGYGFTGFSGFTAGTTQMGKTNVSFTAQYVQVFSLNATGRAGFTFTADGYDTNTTGTGIYHSGTVVSVAVAPASAFERWSDGNTDNPRIVTLTANTTLTAQMADLESDDATVDIYENLASNKCIIVHELTPTTAGGITYTPIDMGYGVAWADRNVGATSTTDHGGWYQWGGTTDLTSTVSSGRGPSSGGKSTTNTSALTATEDAATVVMGANWHMPTKAEWESLINNTTVNVSSSTFTNKTDGSKSISLPTGGYYYSSGRDFAAYSFYWANQRYAGDAVYMLRNNKNSRFQVSQYDGTKSNGYTVSPKCVMPIRAIYVPSYTTYTLTINVGNKKYQYVCQEGQQVTVTAHATTSGYSFNEWTEDGSKANPRSFIVTGDMSYTATFAEAPTTNYYDITISTNPASGYGTVNTSSMNDVEEGTTISTSSNTLTIGETTITATKTADDAQYTYAFTGWTDDKGKDLPESVTDDLAIRANFTRTLNTYTVTWKNGEDVIETDTDVPYGETPSYDGETPTKDEDAENTYTFDAWSPAITAVVGNATYTAMFTATPKPAELHIVLKEAEDDDYYNDFANHQGKTANTVTLNRQFTQGRWSTLCLPFEVSGGMMTTLKMSGRVYEFKYATGNANVGEGVNLYFSNAKKMEAGKGYIVNANATLAEKTSFVFSNVKIDVTADSVKPLNSATAYNKLPGYKSEGTIELVGTLRNGTLKGTESGNTYMGLKSNKIYYPNISQGSTIWAYRGIFRSSKALDIKNMQKMRIIVDGEDMGELFIDEDGEILDASGDAPSRKFIRDGVLYIEREGVVYDAQGKRVESSF